MTESHGLFDLFWLWFSGVVVGVLGTCLAGVWYATRRRLEEGIEVRIYPTGSRTRTDPEVPEEGTEPE